MPSAAPILVIDLQTAMFKGHPSGILAHADELAERVRSILAWARTTGHPVCFVRHDSHEPGDPLMPGEPGWAVWPALGQLADEKTFSKQVGDAFSNPQLADWVIQHDADEVILLGAQSDYCVAATVKGALARGLAVTVVSDTHSTVANETQSADDIIGEHNAMFERSGAKLVTAARLTSAARA